MMKMMGMGGADDEESSTSSVSEGSLEQNIETVDFSATTDCGIVNNSKCTCVI